MSLNFPEAELMKSEQKKSIKPYGTWQSKVSAELITQATPGLSSLRNFNDTATTEIYTILFVGSVRCV